jgi:hypothetical protein
VGCSLPLAPFAGSKGNAVVGAGVALPVREAAQDHRLGKRVCVGRSHGSAGQFMAVAGFSCPLGEGNPPWYQRRLVTSATRISVLDALAQGAAFEPGVRFSNRSAADGALERDR